MQYSGDSSDVSAPLRPRWQDDSLLIDDKSFVGNVDDLSLSELSLNDLPPRQPLPPPSRSRPKFSLLARSGPYIPDDEPGDGPEPAPEDPHHDPDVVEDEAPEVAARRAEELQGELEKRKRLAARTREERLQHDLFMLRKLNAAFSLYNDALHDTRSSSERVAEQLQQTNALLDKYVNFLAKSEAITRMIFDERWRGADHDEEIMERERREAEEKARREEEERILSAKRELERLEREARERQEREEKEKVEAEKREKLAARAGYGRGLKNVRGTRSTALARAASTSGIPSRGRPTATTSSASSSGSRVPRPASSVSTRTASSTSSRPGIR